MYKYVHNHVRIVFYTLDSRHLQTLAIHSHTNYHNIALNNVQRPKSASRMMLPAARCTVTWALGKLPNLVRWPGKASMAWCAAVSPISGGFMGINVQAFIHQWNLAS